MKQLGFKYKGNYINGNNSFVSYKRENSQYNFIVTTTKSWYNKFLEASKIAKELNLLDKKDRIKLFDVVINGRRTSE